MNANEGCDMWCVEFLSIYINELKNGLAHAPVPMLKKKQSEINPLENYLENFLKLNASQRLFYINDHLQQTQSMLIFAKEWVLKCNYISRGGSATCIQDAEKAFIGNTEGGISTETAYILQAIANKMLSGVMPFYYNPLLTSQENEMVSQFLFQIKSCENILDIFRLCEGVNFDLAKWNLLMGMSFLEESMICLGFVDTEEHELAFEQLNKKKTEESDEENEQEPEVTEL